jgi:glycosyltransferase involved in cell wall biosynthesis
VRYLQHDGHSNLGMSASQNLGISEAGGEYVAFLDADDVWLPEKLQQQVDILNSQPEAGMLYGSTLYWYSWETDRPDVLIEPGVEPNSLVKPPDLLVRLLQQEIPVPCPSDIMVRRQAAIEAGGFEESFRRIFTDQVFYAKLCLRWPVYVSGQSWFKYRKHQDSAVSVVKQSGGMQRARFTYLNWLESYLDDNRISDSRVRRALRIARWKNRYPGLSRLSAHIRYRARIAKEFLRAAGRQTLPAPAARLLRAHGGKRDGQPR